MNKEFEIAKIKDAKFIFKLRFEKYSVKNSLNSKKISYADHLKWFRGQLKNNKSIFLIYKNKIGYIRIDQSRKKKYLSWNVSKNFRKRKIGTKMLKNFLFKKKKIIMLI